MKRIVASVVLIALILATAIFGSVRVRDITDNLSTLLSTAEAQSSRGEYPELAHTIAELEGYYAKSQRTLFFFLRRECVTSAASSFGVLRAYATKASAADFAAEALRAKKQIQQLRNLFFSII